MNIFTYKPTLSFINGIDNSTIDIPMDNINSILIDKNYDELNQPVVILTVSIDKKILNTIIETQEDSLLSLQIYKYNENDPDDIGECVLGDLFIYMTDENISYTSELDYDKDHEENDRNDLFRQITLYLLKRDSVNNINQVINTVNHSTYKGKNEIKITMTDLVMRVSTYLNPLLLEPLQYNTSYSQIIIPPVSTITEYLEYLNDNVYTFYDSGYRFFVDFDTTYILSKSGKKVEHNKQECGTVIIDIGSLLQLGNDERGYYYDAENRHYYVNVGISSTKFTKNVFTKRLVTNVSNVTSSGDTFTEKIKDNLTKNNKEKTQIIQTTNSNSNLVNNIKSDINNNNIILDINKTDLDANIFTINKEYIVKNADEHREYDGRYLLCCSKQVYLKQNNKFMMSTILRFKRISSR